MATAASEVGFFRLPQVLEIIPIGKTSFYENIKAGLYPAPVRISKRAVGWRKSEIFALAEKLGAGK